MDQESRVAVLSVYDKTGVIEIAECFVRHDIVLVGSGGTADTIRKRGINIVDVSEYTGNPEMPDGLVKTLHPKIHAGILGDWTNPAQRKYLDETHVQPVDFVVVNLYPFAATIKSDPKNFRKAVDNVDIGGPALIRAAAKGALLNHRVVPVTSPEHYRTIIHELDMNGQVSDKFREKLAFEAFNVTANYDILIRDYFSSSIQRIGKSAEK